jgi:hypothetical protein
MGQRVWSRLVALDSPTEPRVTDVGQVEFTVLPVPPEAADAEELVPLELAAPDAAVVELEHAATAATVTTAAAASLVHLNMRGLRTYVPLRQPTQAGRSPCSLGVIKAVRGT